MSEVVLVLPADDEKPAAAKPGPTAAAADAGPPPAPGAAGSNGTTAEGGVAAVATAPTAAAPSTTAPSSCVDEVDYSAWPIKELRRFCTERGMVSDGVLVGLGGEVRAAAKAGGSTWEPYSFRYCFMHKLLSLLRLHSSKS